MKKFMYPVKYIYLGILLALLCGVGFYVYYYTREYIEIKKVIDENKKADEASVDKFIKGVDEIFAKYRENIRVAVESKPKWRPLWKTMTGKKEEALKMYVEHFNKEVFQKEDKFWDSHINDLQYNLDSHKNDMCSKFAAFLKGKGNGVRADEMRARLQAQMAAVFEKSLNDTLKNTIISTVAGIAAEELVRYGVSASVASASAFIGGAAGGATAGSAVPLAGTAVGLVVGGAAGWCVDWYLEKVNNKKMEAQLVDCLNNIEKNVKDKLKKELYKKVGEINNNYEKELHAAY